MKEPEYRFTPEQVAKISKVVMRHWGEHMQTGFDIRDGHPYLYAQSRPNVRPVGYRFPPDGKVVIR